MNCSISLCSCFAGIEDLREKREEVQKQIRDEEGEKAKLQQDLQVLTKRLAHINDGLARKVCCMLCTDCYHYGRSYTTPAVLQAYAGIFCTWAFDQCAVVSSCIMNVVANVLYICSA